MKGVVAVVHRLPALQVVRVRMGLLHHAMCWDLPLS